MLAIVIAAASAVVPAALLAFILPPWPALLGGTLGGVFLYAPLLRAAGAIDSDDRQRLTTLAPLVPLPLRRYVFKVAAWLGEGAR